LNHEIGKINEQKFTVFADGGPGLAINVASSNRDELLIGIR
jgi:hypothetical protein